MPYEPRLFGGDGRGEQPPQSADLPAELAELAIQLGHDADFLAARYPVVLNPATPAAAAANRVVRASLARRRAVRAAAACLLAGAAAWSATAWRSNNLQEHALGQRDAASAREAAHAMIAVPDEPGSPAPLIVPAMLFRELTAPEQEAVLDLWEEEPIERRSMSI